jgi:hypothetical protein
VTANTTAKRTSRIRSALDDPRRPLRAGELRLVGGDVRLQLRPLAVDSVEAEVELEHRDVDRDDAGEQRGHDDDPCDTAREAALPGGAHSMLLAA